MKPGILRKAVAPHQTATNDSPFDGPAQETKLRSGEAPAYYWRAFAWEDPAKDPKTKAAYKFVHHDVDANGEPGAANIRACIAGIGVLNGARGGANIPDEDRAGVYEHLAAHLKDAGRDVPPLRALPDFERRTGTHDGGELRVMDGEDKRKHIVGHAAVFGVYSAPIMGIFRERIREGAFAKTIKEADVRALWNHNPDKVLGRNKSGTLSLKEDNVGLFYDAAPPNTTWANDALESIARGDVNQSSFGFRVVKEEWGKDEQGFATRDLVEVRLFDVSPVTYPAYEDTDVAVRSIAAHAGLDSMALHEAIRKRMMGASLSTEDRDIIKRSADFLRWCMPQEPSAEPAGHSQDPAGRGQSVAVNLRKLALVDPGGYAVTTGSNKP